MLETDKVTVELPAPVNGTISKILFQKGASAKVGDILGYMEEGAVVAKSGAAPLDPAFDRSQGSEAPPATIPPASTPRVMPAAQRALHTAGLEAREVQPSGPGGRTLKEDVQRHLAEGHVDARPATAPQKTELREPRAKDLKPPPIPNLPAAGARQEEVVPMTSL